MESALCSNLDSVRPCREGRFQGKLSEEGLSVQGQLSVQRRWSYLRARQGGLASVYHCAFSLAFEPGPGLCAARHPTEGERAAVFSLHPHPWLPTAPSLQHLGAPMEL